MTSYTQRRPKAKPEAIQKFIGEKYIKFDNYILSGRLFLVMNKTTFVEINEPYETTKVVLEITAF
jgi:hypothetical protein